LVPTSRTYHRVVTRKRLVWIVPALGLIGAQAGHLLTYELIFGTAAPQVQSAGSHSYFPTLAKTGVGVAALVFLAALLVVGAGRVIAGRRIEADRAPSLVRLLAGLFTIQLVCFVSQETIEAMAGGGYLSSVPALVLWGTVGQLPVAAVAALALRWLGARWRPALTAISNAVATASVRPAFAAALVPVPTTVDSALSREDIQLAFNRRGPPSSKRSALN
jgi:hypothetical protein